ncbi:hypothetical protein JCM17478_14710 [Thermopirellula anaerolimosa]
MALGDIRGFQGEAGGQSFDLAIFLAGDVSKKRAAFTDFFDGLFERNRDPFVFPSLARSLEHSANAVRIVRGLQTGLTLRADRTVHRRGIARRGRVGEMREERPRVVRVAVDLGDKAVLYLALDAATRVALKAGAIDHGLRLGRFIRSIRTPTIQNGVLFPVGIARSQGGGRIRNRRKHTTAQ